MKAIINADDFGFSKAVNYGIFEAIKNGIVTSTSLMVNMPGFHHAIALMKKHPELNVGIHLVTTVGYSICKDLPTLTDQNNHFYHNTTLVANCDIEELRKEYQAQMDTFLATGLRPDHIDFHVCFSPVQIQVQMELAKKYNLPIRCHEAKDYEMLEKEGIRFPKNFQSDFYDKGVTMDTLEHILLSSLDKDMIEVMCHPAYIDQTLLDNTSYSMQRVKELDILTSQKIKDSIKQHDIELISFKDI